MSVCLETSCVDASYMVLFVIIFIICGIFLVRIPL
ncbi:MAG: sortase B protein-sorting domain-containing protein [Bacteroidales bacterium]|nr:sortase B protein-sorting domain-containing protein [Bacteroidales bacterium]